MKSAVGAEYLAVLYLAQSRCIPLFLVWQTLVAYSMGSHSRPVLPSRKRPGQLNVTFILEIDYTIQILLFHSSQRPGSGGEAGVEGLTPPRLKNIYYINHCHLFIFFVTISPIFETWATLSWVGVKKNINKEWFEINRRLRD